MHHLPLFTQFRIEILDLQLPGTIGHIGECHYVSTTAFQSNASISMCNELMNTLSKKSTIERYDVDSSCFVEHPNSMASCKFKPFWFKNQAQLSTHSWGTCLQGIFQVFLKMQLIAITLAEIVASSITARRRSE